jgi:hypothetical protein
MRGKMVRVNVRPSRLSNRPVHEPAATTAFDPKTELERMASCCLLGEDQFYVNGQDIKARIFELASTVEAEFVANLAAFARRDLGLRHAPLWLLVALANRQDGSQSARIQRAAVTVLRTPRDALDLAALYWADGRKPLPWSFKQAFRHGFGRWSDFQLQRYATLGRDGKTTVRLRDLMRLVHPYVEGSQDAQTPEETARAALFHEIAKDTVTAPETWESLLPRALAASGRKVIWTGLIANQKIGALAMIRNLRNMVADDVEPDVIRQGLSQIKASDVWPWQVLAAANHAPSWLHDELGALMLRSAGQVPPIKGKVGVLTDVSGSMDNAISIKSQMKRLDAACGVAVVLQECCENIRQFSFSSQLVEIPQGPRGVGLAKSIIESQPHQATYLGPAIERMLQVYPEMNRLIVLTDEQSQYRVGKTPPAFIINFASYQRGVDTDGEVTRINGWSGNVVRFLANQLSGSLIEAAEESDED